MPDPESLSPCGPALLAIARSVALDSKARTGNRIVGYIGVDVPPGLILACGLLPVRLGSFMSSSVLPVARVHETGESDLVARFASLFLGGDLEWIDHVVISNSPPWHVTLLHFLREYRRLETSSYGPPTSLHETHRGDGPATRAYNLQAYRRLLDQLAGLGHAPDEAQLRAAIEMVNSRHARLRAMTAQRRRGEVAGAHAMDIIAQAQVDYTQPPAAPSVTSRLGPRLFFTGSDIGHVDHYAAIERAGCTVVGDDHDWGEASVDVTVGGGDSLTAIAEAYARQPPRAARWPTQVRVADVVARAKASGARGVVVWINEEDHPSFWDLPRLRRGLEAEGLAVLDLGPMPAAPDHDDVTRRIASWLPELEEAVR